MNIYPFLHFFAFLAQLYLLVFVLWKNPKSPLNRACAALLACFVIWSFGFIFFYNPNLLRDRVILFDNIGSFGWISFASFFLWFFLIFTEKKKILKTKIIYPLLFILPALFIYKQWTGFITAAYAEEPYGWVPIPSRSIWNYLYYLYYLSFMIGGLCLLFSFKKKTKEPIKKRQAGILFATVAIALGLGSLTDAVLPMLNIRIIPHLANVIVLIFGGGLTYTVVRYKFMVLTPATAAESIIETMTDSLLLVNPEGKIKTVNQATLNLLGYKEDEIIGQPVEMLFTREGLSKERALNDLIKKVTIQNVEKAYLSKDERKIPVLFSSAIIRDEEGEIKGIVCVAADLTGQKRIEEALASEYNLLQTLMDNIPDFVYFKDKKNRFIRVNKAKAKHSGTTPQKMMGKTEFDFFPEEEAKKCFADDNWVMKSGKPIVNRLEEITSSDGSKRWFSTTKIPRRNKEGEVIGTMGISRDITEIKKLMQELEKAKFTLKLKEVEEQRKGSEKTGQKLEGSK